MSSVTQFLFTLSSEYDAGIFLGYDVLSCCSQFTCAATSLYWYGCKHIRVGHVNKQVQFAAQQGCFLEPLQDPNLAFVLTFLVKTLPTIFLFCLFSFQERLLCISNAYGRLGYCIKRREIGFTSLVMHQIAPTQQPKEQQTKDEAFQICLKERNQQGSLGQLIHTHRLACFLSLAFVFFT